PRPPSALFPYTTLFRLGFDMPAASAIWSMVAPLKPLAEKTSNAASRIRSRFSCWMRVRRRGAEASMRQLTVLRRHIRRLLDQYSGPVCCRPVERAFDSPYALGIPLTAGTAVLTFVQPVKIS